jgi:hypothetical protein
VREWERKEIKKAWIIIIDVSSVDVKNSLTHFTGVKLSSTHKIENNEWGWERGWEMKREIKHTTRTCKNERRKMKVRGTQKTRKQWKVSANKIITQINYIATPLHIPQHCYLLYKFPLYPQVVCHERDKWFDIREIHHELYRGVAVSMIIEHSWKMYCVLH